MYFNKCPRCGDQSYELLETHAHCINCNFSPEQDIGYLAWRDIEFRGPKKARQNQIENERIMRGDTLGDYSYGVVSRGVL